MKLFRLLLFLSLAAVCFGQGPQTPSNGPICPEKTNAGTSTSAAPLTIPNDCGSLNAGFGYSITGSPATMSVVISGVITGSPGVVLDTYTGTTSTTRTPTYSTPYDYFSVVATWTGGTNVTFNVRGIVTMASNGSSSGGGSGNVTGPSSSTAGDVATFADISGKVLQDGGLPWLAAIAAIPAGPNFSIQWTYNAAMGDTPSPTTNGYYPCGYNVTGSAAVAPTCQLSGIPIDASNPTTLTYSDRSSYLNINSSLATLTLPAISGQFALNFSFVAQNNSSGTTAITPTSPNNIDGGSSQAASNLFAKWAALIYSDSAGPNWYTIKFPTLQAFGSTCTNGLNWNASTGTFPCNTTNNVGCVSGCTFVITAENTNVSLLAGGVVATAEQVNTMRFWNSTSKLLGATGCIDVSTADSGGHADVGVYSISGTTLTRQWHTGAISTTTGAQQCGTSLATYTLAAQTNYYLAYCADNTTSIIAAIYPSTGATTNALGNVLGGTNATANTFGHNATDLCTTGVLPGTMTLTNIVNSVTNVQVPLVAIFN
jgi:hypothetical protein